MDDKNDVIELKYWKKHLKDDSMVHIYAIIDSVMSENCWPEDVGKYKFCKDKL
jgi:hypothetical protein